MEYSQYQQDIFSWVKNGDGNGASIAVAGSGKTTTAVKAMDFITPYVPDMSRFIKVQFNCFGKDIATELASRITHLRYAKAATYNSTSWKAVRNAFREIELDADKTINILQYAILKPITDEDDKRFKRMKGPIARLTSLFKGMCVMDTNKANELFDETVEHYDIELPNDKDFKDIFLATFNRTISNTGIADFDDQIYFVEKFDLPVETVDWLMIDEFQDTNEMQARLVDRICPKGRKLVIGDPDQCIYSWRGSTPDAIGRFMREMNAKLLPLYICYRCGYNIVNEAKKIVPHIEAAPGAIPGTIDTIKMDKFWKLIQSGDFVICRTTAPLVKRCLQGIRNKKKGYVKGREIGDDLKYTIDKITNCYDGMDTKTFHQKLNEWATWKISILEKYGRDNQILNIKDRVDTISVFLEEGATTVTELKNHIDIIFLDAGTGIAYMTGHKSKGLQSKRVFILRPDLIPHPRAKKEWQLEEERRLQYVMVTRAQEELYFVQKEDGEK